MINSTDLHSMGQYVQDGRRTLFETVLAVKKPKAELMIPADEENADGMSYLNNRALSFVNNKAMDGTILAHVDGGVPNILIEIPEMNAYEYGYMVYFFEKACAVSGYCLGVNPFNQPGVENYKNNMYALLGKPGYEDLQKALTERLNG
jgi:glucose-6-phosphate isomerase